MITKNPTTRKVLSSQFVPSSRRTHVPRDFWRGFNCLAILFLLLISFDTSASEVEEVNLSFLEPGQMMVILGDDGPRPIWVVRRTKKMIDSIEASNKYVNDPESSDVSRQPSYVKNKYRSIKKEYFVVIGQCFDGISEEATLPITPAGLTNMEHVFTSKVGFFCLYNGASYDHAGRVFRTFFGRNVKNMRVPEHHFKDEKTLVIGASN